MDTSAPEGRVPLDKVYPRGLAESAVYTFCKSYARATEFVAKKLGYSVYEYQIGLIHLFMYDNRRWNRARDALKAAGRQKLYERPITMPAALLARCTVHMHNTQLMLPFDAK